jgi:cytochrome o ubiquinol oxidase operon protein cyoD
MNENMTIKNYIIGFALSLIPTSLAFALVWIHITSKHELLSHEMLIPLIVILALVQIIVQLFCFLHITQSRERLYLLICALGVVCILVGGSLWIMFTLQGRMMPDDMQMQYMDMQGGL